MEESFIYYLVVMTWSLSYDVVSGVHWVLNIGGLAAPVGRFLWNCVMKLVCWTAPDVSSYKKKRYIGLETVQKKNEKQRTEKRLSGRIYTRLQLTCSFPYVLFFSCWMAPTRKWYITCPEASFSFRNYDVSGMCNPVTRRYN